MFHVYHAFLSDLCNLVVTCWERVALFDLLYVMFSCVFVTFPCGVLGQMRYLIVSNSDLCLLSYFNSLHAGLFSLLLLSPVDFWKSSFWKTFTRMPNGLNPDQD